MNTPNNGRDATLRFHQFVKSLCRMPENKNNGDTDSIRLAAVSSALVETIQEKADINNCSMDTNKILSLSVINPASLFLSTVTTLNATMSSKDDSSIDVKSSTTQSQTALLKILQRTIPYISNCNPNLYASQFPFLVETLRFIVECIYNKKKELNNVEGKYVNCREALLCCCIRCSVSCLYGILILKDSIVNSLREKILKFYHDMILFFFNNDSSKIGKEAHAAAFDLLRLSCLVSTSYPNIKSQDTHVNFPGEYRYDKCKLSPIISCYMGIHVHNIISGFINEERENNNEHDYNILKILNLLSFLQRSLFYFPVKEKLILINDLIKLLLSVNSRNIGKNRMKKTKLNNERMVMKSVFLVLIQTLDHNQKNTIEMTILNETKMNEMSQKILTSLLRKRLIILSPETINQVFPNGTVSLLVGDILVFYVRTISTITCRNIHIINEFINRTHCSNVNRDRKKNFNLFNITTTLRLLPFSISSIITCIAHESCSSINCKDIASELGVLIRTCFSLPLNIALEKGDETNFSNEYSCVIDSMKAVEKLLDHNFHLKLGLILPCLVSFIVEVVGVIGIGKKERKNNMNKMMECASIIVDSIVGLHAVIYDVNSKEAIRHAVGCIVNGLGLELFLSMVDLSKVYTKTISDTNKTILNKTLKIVSNDCSWILPVLKMSISCSSQSNFSPLRISTYRQRLAFFEDYVLPYAWNCHAASIRNGISEVDALVYKKRVVDIWALFPCFCHDPLDLTSTFPLLVPSLVKAMNDKKYPDLLYIICKGLKYIADGVSRLMNDGYHKQSINGDVINNTSEEATVLSEVSVKLLPALFQIVELLHGINTIPEDVEQKKELPRDNYMSIKNNQEAKEGKHVFSKDRQQNSIVIDVITAYALFSPVHYLERLFKKIMHRLLKAIQSVEDQTEKVCKLLELVQALVRSKILDEKNISFLYRVVQPLIKSNLHNPRTQKRGYKVITDICQNYTSFLNTPDRVKDMSNFVISSVTTLHVSARYMRLKCIKLIVNNFDAKEKEHMNIISNIIGEILLCLKDFNGKTRDMAYELLLAMAKIKNNMPYYFQTIVAALGSQTPHARSAAVMALSRLVFEYARHNHTVQSLLPSLLRTILVLFDEKSREVLKSAIGFVRVCVSAMEKDYLHPLLSEVVNCIMKFNRGKGRFRSKIKIILKKLINIYGFENIIPLVPDSEFRLLVHLRKTIECKNQHKFSKKESTPDREEQLNDCSGSINQIMFDKNVISCRNRATLSNLSINYRKESDDVVKYDNEGKMIIDECLDESGEVTTINNGCGEKKREVIKVFQSHKKQKINKSEMTNKLGRVKKIKNNTNVVGFAYKSNKTGGDVKCKGQVYEPYAYIPLSDKFCKKKNTHYQMRK